MLWVTGCFVFWDTFLLILFRYIHIYRFIYIYILYLYKYVLHYFRFGNNKCFKINKWVVFLIIEACTGWAGLPQTVRLVRLSWARNGSWQRWYQRVRFLIFWSIVELRYFSSSQSDLPLYAFMNMSRTLEIVSVPWICSSTWPMFWYCGDWLHLCMHIRHVCLMLIRKHEFMLHDASVYLNFHEYVLFSWCHDFSY